MKKLRVLLIAVLLLSTGSFFQPIAGQQKTKAELEREQQIQKEINDQKKAIADQKNAQAEAELMYREQQMKMEDLLKDMNVRVDEEGRYRDAMRMVTPRLNREYQFAEPFVFTPGNNAFYLHSLGESERTTWDLSKSVKENTFSKNYTFDVDKSVQSVVMSVMGDCKEGEIRIKIVMPNGKNYSDIVIDEFGNLNWRKSFSISDTENQDKAGEWKFQVTSTNATGYFRISIQSS